MDVEREARIVTVIVDTWKAMLRDQVPLPLTPAHCILGARAGIEALTFFGLPAKPAAVVASVRNPPAVQLTAQGVPADEWPPHASRLTVGDPVDAERAVIESGGRGLNLHLVPRQRPARSLDNAVSILPSTAQPWELAMSRRPQVCFEEAHPQNPSRAQPRRADDSRRRRQHTRSTRPGQRTFPSLRLPPR